MDSLVGVKPMCNVFPNWSLYLERKDYEIRRKLKCALSGDILAYHLTPIAKPTKVKLWLRWRNVKLKALIFYFLDKNKIGFLRITFMVHSTGDQSYNELIMFPLHHIIFVIVRIDLDKIDLTKLYPYSSHKIILNKCLI